MTPNISKLTLEQLRLAKNQFRRRSRHPCSREMERLFTVMDNNINHNVMTMKKYLNALDTCIARKDGIIIKQDNQSTMHYLNLYVDQRKHKKK